MANRTKTKRNERILYYWHKGYRQSAIAKMFKMKESAVNMVIFRANHAILQIAKRKE